jgi:hypothetical protein
VRDTTGLTQDELATLDELCEGMCDVLRDHLPNLVLLALADVVAQTFEQLEDRDRIHIAFMRLVDDNLRLWHTEREMGPPQ